MPGPTPTGETDGPALSVLVLSHDYERYLAACLESVLAQTFPSFEVIVLDDGSSDDSLAIARRYASDPRVRVVAHETNQGFVATLREGTGVLSRGEFLVMVSADDLVLEPETFARQVAALRVNPAVAACMTGFVKVGPRGERIGRRRLVTRPRTLSGDAFVRRVLTKREFSVMHSGTVIRASAYRAVGGYRTDLTNYGDFALWMALARVGPIAILDAACYGYRVHGAQMSGSPARRRAVLREGIAVVREEAAIARARGVRVSDARALRARAADLALADAFAGRRMLALRRCADVLAEVPAIALTSAGWWMAAVRALLGRRAWAALARFAPNRD
ncbi:MAG: glycosyltransferase [Dehalococcoidia bacterium]